MSLVIELRNACTNFVQRSEGKRQIVHNCRQKINFKIRHKDKERERASMEWINLI